ncbi:sensor histidine kinase [Streptomyces sp. NPDC012888]|uniref:sensor histidine kinase n=1 Tax=Streptomyces sp. NPDC012888 TaxID=3364855 RepID=UPI0036BE3209
MTRLTGWWSRRSSAAKVEIYTRWSFHSFVLIEIVTIGLGALASAGRPEPLFLLPVVLVVVHAFLCGFVSSRSLDWALQRRARPVRPALVLALLSWVTTMVVLLVDTTRRPDEHSLAPTVVSGVIGFGLGSLTLVMRRMRRMVYVVPATAAAVALTVFALGRPPAEALGYCLGLVIGGGLLTFTFGFSRWLLTTVWELDGARELQARLAVAEERLRFGRDLHDVMGRNLAVIALKSELAVQLARRGRPEAVEQMIEVQRIARESQREVRDVVRGYREADLAVELEGARGVLAAAGINCRVELRDRRELPAAVQSALGWVVREATTNVLRHGDARNVVIRLYAGKGEGEDGLVLDVENDGAPAEPAGTPGSGLAGLRERLAVLEGTLDAGTVAGGRFRLRAVVPGRECRPAEEAEIHGREVRA